MKKYLELPEWLRISIIAGSIVALLVLVVKFCIYVGPGAVAALLVFVAILIMVGFLLLTVSREIDEKLRKKFNGR